MRFGFHLRKSGLKYWLVTVLLVLSVFAVAVDATTSGYVSPIVTPSFTFLPSFTFHPSFTFTFATTSSSTHMPTFTFHPTFTFIFPTTTTGPVIPNTDWAVVGIDAIPPNPNAGDLMAFSMNFAALSSNVPFPQSVYIQCQIDGFSCGAGVIAYPGPIGAARIVTASNYWPSTPGSHILTWFIGTANDPNPGNNALSAQFYVQPAQAPFPTTQTMIPTQTAGPTTMQITTQPTTIIQTSIQTVTPTTSTGSPLFLQGDMLPLIIIGLLVVIILVLALRKRGPTPTPPKPTQ